MERDTSYETRKDQTLKERLAAAVVDQSVAREIRRLTHEAPLLDFTSCGTRWWNGLVTKLPLMLQ